jgi:signal transduction histidine kinase/ligand-binding sensor domain-containing protein
MKGPTTLLGILFLTALLLSSGQMLSYGQKLPDDLQFERITIPGTIRSSQATNIIQDKLGLIWIAGHGLFRYDGFKFKLYRDVPNRNEVFNSSDILCLLYDSVGNRLLIGTRRFGIAAYSYATDEISALSTSKVDLPIINQLTQTADGKIWAGSYNRGLFLLEKDSLVKVDDPGKKIIRPTTVFARGTKLYVGERGKIIVLENKTIVEEIALAWQGNPFEAYHQVSALHFDHAGQLWIGTEKNGVIVYEPSTKKFVRYFPPSQAPFFSKIMRIQQDSHGLVWMLTKANGAALYNPTEDKLTHLIKDPFSQKSISSDNCFSILEDRQGIIWIGATGDLNKFDHQQQKFRHIFHNPLDKLSLSDNMVRGLYEDHEGKIWIGTDGGFINILDLGASKINTIPVRLKNDSTNYVPLYFHELDKRIMLIATSYGLLQYDRKTERISEFTELRESTHHRIIRQLLSDGDNLYLLYKGYLIQYNRITKQTTNFSTPGTDHPVNITAIHLDDKKRLWLGSNEGVSLYHPKTASFTFIPLPNLPVATDGSRLLSLSVQQIGDRLYIGTFNAGLWEIDISDVNNIPPAKSYSVKDGLPSATIYAAVAGNDRYVWLSTNSGVVKFDPEKKTFVTFSINEGLQEEEFNRLAYTKTRDGKIIFGGINGINIFDPTEINVNTETFSPEILTASFHNPLSKTPSEERFYSGDRNIEVASDQNFASFHFFVPYYRLPRRYNLYYKLENFEKEWKEVSSENIVTYAHLPSGQYSFNLRTVGVDGVEKERKISFTIAPPIWQTWWFILLSIAVVSFLVMTIIRSYIRRAQYDRQRLEILLKIRTSEIERSREELQILNQKKDLIFSILSHDLRSPLTTLKGFLGYLINHAHEMSMEELKRHAANIKNSVTNSLDLIDNTLFWSLSQMGNIQYTPHNFPLQSILEKLRGLYQLTADKKGILFTIECADDISVHGDENMVYVTLRNLVSNALKFTTEGKPVTISCKKHSDYVEINVTDRGIGMSEDYLRKILSMDQPMLKKGTSNEKGTGLGLLLCKKFIELNKGELLIDSVENVGTTFTVILPLGIHEPADQVVEK